jgi:hypothetical protein
VAPNALPKSPVSSPHNEVVPHINIRSPRLQPGKFVIGETKRVLQHYPLQSGRRRNGLDQGTKAGNARVRRGMIELAWGHLVHQKASATLSRVIIECASRNSPLGSNCRRFMELGNLWQPAASSPMGQVSLICFGAPLTTSKPVPRESGGLQLADWFERFLPNLRALGRFRSPQRRLAP